MLKHRNSTIKKLLLLSVFWTFLMPTLEGKNLLTCPFDPRTEKTEFEQNGWKMHGKLRAAQIRQRVTKARMYREMHPTIREWVDGYRKNYFQDAPEGVVLYNDNQNGIQIRMMHRVSNARDALIVFARTRFFEDDVAWNYPKEPAINPQTGRPWIELSASELREVNRGNNGMDEPDQEFLKDVLAILNENFHYFYGMQLVDLGRNPETNPEELIGKIIPEKFLLYGSDVDMVDTSDKTEQQVSLYQALGHPVYAFGPLLNPEYAYRGTCSHCGGKGVVTGYLRSGMTFTLIYFNQVNVSEVNPSFLARSVQVFGSDAYLDVTLKRFKTLCEDRGVNLRQLSANKTPLARALYLVYHKMEGYVEELSKHQYVTSSRSMNGFEEGVNHVYDVVPIKGLIEEKSSSRSSSGDTSKAPSRSSSRTRSTNSRNAHRNQRSSRGR